MQDRHHETRTRLAAAITPHVVFEGWSPAAFAAAVEEAGIDASEAALACPRGAADLARFLHLQGDAGLRSAFEAAQSSGLRYSEKVALAIRLRLELAGDREVARRSTALYALPLNAAEGAALVWGTADAIWRLLGDTSDDFNWYSKRAILAAVYGACLLFWLGDTGNGAATRAFIDRRISDVMRFEKTKARARGSAVLGPVARAIDRVAGGIRAPKDNRGDLPGYQAQEKT